MSFAAFAGFPTATGPDDSIADGLRVGIVLATDARFGSIDGLEDGVARFPTAAIGTPGAVVA
jgi:hypothetical protein